MADSLIEKLEACAEAHRMWSRQVPGSGQITMVANLLDEAAKRIAELERERDIAEGRLEVVLESRAELEAELAEHRDLNAAFHRQGWKDAAVGYEQRIEELEAQLTAQRRDREAMKTAWNEEMNELRARLDEEEKA